MKKRVDLSNHNGTDRMSISDNRESYLEEFGQRWRERLEEIRQEELLVCILGPTKDTEYWHKRVQIKNELESQEINCTCFFLEDELPMARGGLLEGSLRSEEEILLGDADFIIALDLSAGVLGEIHDFAQDDDLAMKMLLLIPEWYKDGYSARGILRDTLAEKYFFTQESLRKCDLVSKCVERVWLEKQRKYMGRSLIRQVELLKKRYHYE